MVRCKALTAVLLQTPTVQVLIYNSDVKFLPLIPPFYYYITFHHLEMGSHMIRLCYALIIFSIVTVSHYLIHLVMYHYAQDKKKNEITVREKMQ